MGTAPPLTKQSSGQSLSSLEAETVTLPRRDFYSVVSVSSGPGQQDGREESGGCSFSTPPRPAPRESRFAGGSPVGVGSCDVLLPARVGGGERSRHQAMILGRLNQTILPLSLGCGTLDLLPELSIEATANNAELFHIRKYYRKFEINF
jgi:hypothetical protein